MIIHVIEPATATNLFPRGYMLANADLRAAFGDDEARSVQHFNRYGHAEGRRQVTREFLDSTERRLSKLTRFRDCFASMPDGASKLPIHFGDATEALSDYESESAHPTADGWSDELAANPDKLYADIGAGLRTEIFDNCLYVEVYPSLTTDVVIPPDCKLPLKSASLDGIGCFAVLEHVRWPWTMAAEFARVVRPGGKIYIDWPFLAPLHGYPSHYYNATREGLRAMFADSFDVSIATLHHQGPDFTVKWILDSLLTRLNDPAARDALGSMTVAQLAAIQPQSDFWKRVISALDDESVSTLSCGNRLVGVRRSTGPS